MNTSYEVPAQQRAADLVKPTIPGAFDNGLLPIALLTSPVRVTFPAWMIEGRGQYQLMWDGKLIGDPMTTPPGTQPGDPLSLAIPITHLDEGNHQLRYLATNLENGASDPSEPTSVIIDLTEPGRPSLAAIQFPKVTQDGLTSDELTQLGDSLPGEIYGYNGIDVHDVIQTYWGGVEGPSKEVDRLDIDAGKVIIPFTRAFLESLGDVEEPVKYHVTDRAGNKSQDSLTVSFALQLALPLPDPEVAEAKPDGTLDPADTTAGATVIVRSSANLRADDFVQLYWDGPGGSDEKQRTILPEHAGKELQVVFSSLLVNANLGKEVTIRYTVTRQGALKPSEPLTLTVLNPLVELPKPRLLEADASGQVNPNTVPDTGATAFVPDYGMRANDRIVTVWTGVQSHTTAEQTVVTPGEMAFIIPKAIVTAAPGGPAQLTYRITRGSADPLTSLPELLTVGTPLMLDPIPVTLNVPVYIAAEALPTFPPGSTVQRLASGGRPPYRYSSSAPSIANVNADSGLVTPRGNGTVTITVTDQNGDTRGYTVSIVGVRRLAYVGKFIFSGAIQYQPAGGYLPDIVELKAIYNQYSQTWPFAREDWWSSTGASARRVVDFRNGDDGRTVFVAAAVQTISVLR